MRIFTLIENYDAKLCFHNHFEIMSMDVGDKIIVDPAIEESKRYT